MAERLYKDIWKYSISKYLSPLSVTRLRATCRFFRMTCDDTAASLRSLDHGNGYLILFHGARQGHQDIVEMMMSRSNARSIEINCNLAFHEASCGGHREIVYLLMAQGACDWDAMLRGAARGGHHDILQLAIAKGANDWDGAFAYAAEGGHRDIMKLLEEKGSSNNYNFDWNWGLYCAACGGHREIVEYLISKGADTWNIALSAAVCHNRIDIAELMIAKGANDFNGALVSAVIGGHYDMVKMMIAKGANNWDIALRRANDESSTNDIVNLLKQCASSPSASSL